MSHKPDKKIEQFYKYKLNFIKFCDDYECSHGRADDILCELLKDLGYGEVVELYDSFTRWYG